LNQQIRKLEEDFTKSGGIREKMYKARKEAREKEANKKDAKR
jgi:four helix bundle suffix protein